MNENVTKEQWVAMFREIGLEEDQMMRWHRVFEVRHPDAHQSFLQWLGLGESEVERIRAQSR